MQGGLLDSTIVKRVLPAMMHSRLKAYRCHLLARALCDWPQLHWICRHMLQFSPDNYKYHQGLRQALNLMPDAAGKLSDDQRQQLTLLYGSLQKKYLCSSAARRIPLDFKVGLFCQISNLRICFWRAHVQQCASFWFHSLACLLIHSSSLS